MWGMASLGPVPAPARPGRSRRRALALVTAAGVLAVTAACGADDTSDPEAPVDTSEATDATSGATPDPGASASEPPATVSPTQTPRPPDEVPDSEVTGVPFPLLEGDACDAEVTLTGVREDSWSGAGTVAPSSGDTQPTTYQATDGASSVLTVYAEGAGFDAAVVLQLADGSYSSVPGDPGLDVAADGSGGTVDIEALAAEDPGSTLRVQATFSC